MTWLEYHELTKHSAESLRRSQHYLDWANMPNPFRHYEGVPVVDTGTGPIDIAYMTSGMRGRLSRLLLDL